MAEAPVFSKQEWSMKDSLWTIVLRVVEGKMLAPKQVQQLWTEKEVIEEYVASMLFASSSVVYTVKDRRDPNEKHFLDGCATRVLEIMHEAYDALSEDGDRQAWQWRFVERMTLEEVGQLIADAPRGCRDAGAFWRMKAKRKLDHVALILARKMCKGVSPTTDGL